MSYMLNPFSRRTFLQAASLAAGLGSAFLAGCDGSTGMGKKAEQQAAYFARLYLINLMNSLPITIWYNWQDGPNPQQREDNFGIVTFNEKPKPVYYAAHTLVQELTNFRYTERLSFPTNEDYALRFTNGTASKYVIWTTGNAHTAILSVKGTSAIVTSTTGEKRAMAAVNGQMTMELSGNPQYLET